MLFTSIQISNIHRAAPDIMFSYAFMFFCSRNYLSVFVCAYFTWESNKHFPNCSFYYYKSVDGIEAVLNYYYLLFFILVVSNNNDNK